MILLVIAGKALLRKSNIVPLRHLINDFLCENRKTKVEKYFKFYGTVKAIIP